MQAQVSVKLILLNLVLFSFIFLSSCDTGGDSYTSTVSYGSYYSYGFKVSSDRRKVQGFSADGTTDWIDLKSGGTGKINGYVYFEISNRKVRVCYSDYNHCGDWVDLCGSDSSTASNGYSIKVEVNNGYARYCYNGISTNGSFQCGNWVQFDKAYVGCVSCPSGYTYNPDRNKCEADPIMNYTCPYAGGRCIEQSRGVAYCSPYSCNNTSIGVWCANDYVNTSNMNSNNIGMYQCSHDSFWFTDLAGCQAGCNYYQCKLNNNWYHGDITICQEKCVERGQCLELQ